MADWSFTQGLPQAPKTIGPDITDVLQAQGQQQKNQLVQREVQGRNMLARMFQDPQALDPNTGTLRPQYVNRLAQAGFPDVAMQYMQDAQKLQSQRAATALAGQKVTDANREWVIDTVAVPAHEAYETEFKRTGSAQSAQAAAQQVYSQGLDTVKSSGRLTPQEATQLSTQYDHNRARANIFTAQQLQQQREHQVSEGRQEESTQSTIQHQRYQEDIEKQKLERSEATDLFVGQTTDAEGKKQDVTVRPGPGGKGWVDTNGKPVEGVTGLHKMGAKADVPVDDKAVETTAQAIANYQQAPLSGYALRSPGAQQIMQKVIELNPDYQATRYPEVAKAMRDFGTGKQGDTTRALNVSIDHLASLKELIAALNGGNVQQINRVANFLQSQLGLSSAPTTFDAAKTVIGSEVIKAVQGGASALGDREEIRKSIDAKNTPDQLNDAVTEYKRLMAGQLYGLEQQYEDATGFGAESKFPFRKKLRPGTIAELEGARTPGGAAGGSAALPADLPPLGNLPEGAKVWDKPAGTEGRKVVAVVRGGKWVAP